MNLSVRKPSKRVISAASGAAALAALLFSTAGACSSSSNGNAAEHAAQGASTNLLEQNQPLPVFPTSAYRYELIQIEAVQALGTPTTAFFFPEGTSVTFTGGSTPHFSAPPLKVCPAQGLPIPSTASLSNPQQVVNGQNGTSDVVGQMDPNGVYTPPSATGTNVLCVSTTGGVKLANWEGPVFDESGSAVWSDTQGVVDVGPSALPTCAIASATGHDATKLAVGTKYYHCTDTTGKAVNSGAVR